MAKQATLPRTDELANIKELADKIGENHEQLCCLLMVLRSSWQPGIAYRVTVLLALRLAQENGHILESCVLQSQKLGLAENPAVEELNSAYSATKTLLRSVLSVVDQDGNYDDDMDIEGCLEIATDTLWNQSGYIAWSDEQIAA